MKTLLFIILTACVLMSCTLATGTQNTASGPSALEIKQLQKSFMSSYYAERTGAPAGSARALTPFAGLASPSAAKATVPVDRLTTSAAFASLSPLSFANYPEPGQTTSFTASQYAVAAGGFNVYDIQVTTSYPSGDVRKTYFEEYYVEDANDVGNWTFNDPIVEYVGGVWTQNQAARKKMLLTFTDNSTRTETIVMLSPPLQASGHKFPASAFDINGSLDLSQAVVPVSNDGDANIMFSSIVQYYVTPSINNNFWFWTGSNNQNILGIRYYTEVAAGSPGTGTYTAYTTSYEKTLSNLNTTGGSFTTTLPGITAGSVFSTLAESVLRQRVVYGLALSGGSSGYNVPSGAGAITTNMKTRVVDVTGSSAFYLTQMNNDYATVSVPTGNADAILTGNPSLSLFARTQSITPAAGILPFAILTSDISGAGSLATLVTSIQTGSAYTPVTGPTPISSLTGTSGGFTFGGQSAVGLSTTNTLDLSTAGTVEAWVWIQALTDTAGIIHNGVKVDFSDEGYSLQGWGASGQIGIILDKIDPNPSGAYDYVLSSINLAASPPGAKVWYYLAATWDKATKKIYLYINGIQRGSGTMSQTAGGVRHATDQVVIGSQLPSTYSTQYGYFGLNGIIVGASVSAGALPATTILTRYTASSSYTSGW
jgi:hypothetical protein